MQTENHVDFHLNIIMYYIISKEGYQSIDGGQNCYRLVSKQPKSWDNAQEFCKSEGGNLVSIRDGFEAAYVSLIKTGSVNLEWIGLRNVSLK